jgi:hypothetical protein
MRRPPRRKGRADRFGRRKIRATRPAVATISPIPCPVPARSVLEISTSGRSNMALANNAPTTAPTVCATM